jgi:hypothetical protein
VGAGYWLAEVLMVRQIRRLAEGMRELALGDFSRAHAIADELVGFEPAAAGRKGAERHPPPLSPPSTLTNGRQS